MTPAARYAASVDVLDGFLSGEPAEKLLSNWARRNRYAGSKDRAAVRDIVFDCLRKLNSYAQASGLPDGRGIAVGHCLSAGLDPDQIFSGVAYAPVALDDAEQALIAAAQASGGQQVVDLPDWLQSVFETDLGATATKVAQDLCHRAPVDLRVNVAKTTPSGAARALAAEGIMCDPVADVASALRVVENPRRVAGSKPYQSGQVELQDAASQALVGMLDLQAGQSVLDYCAGGGGKTLAMAARVPDARYSAWDISAARLAPLEERAARAGAKVTLLAEKPSKATYDLVLVDAPCSGSGAWRRNPEGKWRLTQDKLAEVQAMQAQVLAEAAQLVKAGGTLVYATCSVLERENTSQVKTFLRKTTDYEVVSTHNLGLNCPGDGFYCAILKKQF
ncbi:RsmB/NOP family class I SAM-dependent RNA methyltransferase [Roseobacter sp. N2S]|uniref:RsmB/NOP family class I SAM-dependent RNA methyltransferase n=1 Tax=Roseobacter sp. N2S TaxID=2663844 RepID=UPI002867620F|nr:RsmB/NOP family class I SAM-dependent RNA methyltransferase [Roseobacter sp. N2S]MDR6265522.1 16S rRNA (cytosine967-C5)-methyltransferase [Roseobacter sp. N2S]